MLNAIDSLDAQRAYDTLFVETQTVAGWLNDFGQGLMFAILDKHISISSRADELEGIDIGDVPKHSEVKIPFFFEVDCAHAAPSEA